MPYAARPRSPPRAARPRHQLARRAHPSGSPGASPLPARGARPARQPPTAGGPLRRAARGGVPAAGTGSPARLPSSGLPLGPRRSRLVCAARPHTVRHAPPATAVDPSAADRWPGWSASLHTLRPRLGRGEVCSPSLAQKVLGGRRVGHTKWATLLVPEWPLRGQIPATCAGPSARGRRGPAPTHPPARHLHRANWWVRPGTAGTPTSRPACAIERLAASNWRTPVDVGGRRSWRQLRRTGCRVGEASSVRSVDWRAGPALRRGPHRPGRPPPPSKRPALPGPLMGRY